MKFTSFLSVLFCAALNAQSTGDFIWQRKTATGASEVFITPSNSSILGVSAGGNPVSVSLGSGVTMPGNVLTIAPPWSAITGTPTTLAGYGITDGVTSSGLSALLANYLTTAAGASTYAPIVHSHAWGAITGTLSAQSDLQAALDGKAPSSHTQAWSTITGTPTTRSGYGITDAQPLDTDLTAIAGVVTTSYGRGLLALPDQAALQTAVGITPDVDATPNTVVLRDNNGSALVNLSLSVNNGASEVSILRPSVLEFYNSARDGKVSLAPPATIGAADDYLLRLPPATGTLLTDTSALDPWQLSQRSATDGQALVWSAANSRWQPGSGAADGRFNPRGLWANGVSYTADDAVMVPGGGAFFCVQSHTSNAANDEPLSGTNWTNYWAMFADTSPFAVPLSVAEGGTGQTTASGAINALLPAQAGHSGHYLTTDGTTASWAASSGVALGDSPTWTGTHTFSSGVNIYDKVSLKTTGEAADATAIEVVTDPVNPAVRALRLLPPAVNGRLYLGKSGQNFYALNLQYCATIESLPGVSTTNGIGLGQATNTSISRSADGTQIGCNHPSDGGLTIYHDASYAPIAASQLVARIHRASGISYYGTNTSSTVYERVSMAYDSGAAAYYIDTQKGSGGGATRAFEIRTGGVVRVRVSASGQISMPGLPTTDPGVSGQLWNDAGALKISP